MTKPRVVITGATGYIAGQLLPAFQERYDLRMIDVRTEDRNGQTVAGVERADLLADASERLVPFFSGVDVVVHCGFHRPAGDDPQARYD
ncbi:MAG TPA: NAD-dependent epimerase/dehydratase family protein, partial [Herpetosiphonaceae bacterium]|nr:NAD-dependent epimerase/dehydratase family protein [Herpetosiphonaceae bacterium]